MWARVELEMGEISSGFLYKEKSILESLVAVLLIVDFIFLRIYLFSHSRARFML